MRSSIMPKFTDILIAGSIVGGLSLVFKDRIDQYFGSNSSPVATHALGCIVKTNSTIGTGNVFYNNGCNVPINVSFCVTHALSGSQRYNEKDNIPPGSLITSISGGNGSIIGELAASSGITLKACVAPQRPTDIGNNQFVCK